MDFSINKINLSEGISFKGLEGAYNDKTVPVFRFYAPAHRKDETVYLEFFPLDKDETTSQFKNPKKFYTLGFSEKDVVELPQDMVRQAGAGFGYRYKIVDKKQKIRYALDPFKTMKFGKNNTEINLVNPGQQVFISPKAGTMRHSFLDSDVVYDNKSGLRAQVNKEFVRNHFNKLGGSIKGLNWLLTQTDELEPYRYFMTTPDIGVDKISSHKYWPNNQYQCNNLEDFKEFNFELFKRGKGYVADGAFTSQGIQSPLVQHVLKWGERSPFYNMLKIDGKIALGVLPDAIEGQDTNPYEHIGFRIVNPKGKNYDKNKPTYIQLYDDRLLSPESQVDGKLHFEYDTTPKDSYEISTHQDSVQPYAFEVDPNDSRLKVFKDKNAVLATEIDKRWGGLKSFVSFDNFSLTTKSKVAGATCWDGNTDIIKMNLSNPSRSLENQKGYVNARNYLYGVASYWSGLVQSHLILETAKKPSKFGEIARNNGISNELLAEIKKSVKNNTFNSIVLLEDYDTKELIKNFPLQTLETSEELSAIFAQPQFAEELFQGDSFDKMANIFDTVVKNIIPKDYRGNEEYIKYVKKTYGNEILRYIFVTALNKEAINDNGSINLDKLKEVSLKSLEKHTSVTPKDERSQVIEKIKTQLTSSNIGYLTGKLSAELKNVSLEDFKMAEAIVLQGRGGLNWRFDAAKDIGDLDSVRAEKKTLNQIWQSDEMQPGVENFFKNFIARIRKNNPSPYIINEVTSLGEFCDVNSEDSLEDFDPRLTQAWRNAGKSEKYEEKPIYTKQNQFLEETNSTTISEYAKGFNAFSVFAGVDPEHSVPDANSYKATTGKAGDLSILKREMEELMKYSQSDASIFSHMFVGNHDKPSVLHTLPLNMSVFMAENLENLDDNTKELIRSLTGRDYLKNVCPQAVGVGLVMQGVINKSLPKSFDEEDKAKLSKALRNLVNGKKPDGTGKFSFQRARAFGVRPFEITIKDMIENAGIAKNEKDLENKVRDFHHAMMQSSMNQYERLWQVMNACVGTPTLFGGNEFVQTGYETPSKNVYLGIRNEVLHDLKEDKRYQNYYNKMYQISGMYKLPGLDVLRDGTPYSLEMYSDLQKFDDEALKEGVNLGAFDYFVNQVANSGKGYNLSPAEYGIDANNGNHESFEKVKDIVFKKAEAMKNSDGFQLWPIYRKNSKGNQAVSIVTNLGLPNKKASWQDNAQMKSKELTAIPIKDNKGACPFEDNTELIKVGYDNKKEDGYIVKDGKIVRKDNKKIRLTDTVSVFVPKK